MAGETTRLFTDDATMGRTEIFHYDTEKDDGSFSIETIQVVDDLVEANKYLANSEDSNWQGDMHRVASIPMNMFSHPSLQGIVTPAGRILDQKAFKKWLNDPDNRVFRTKLGHL
ncbi:MAG TPA: hypothetical protein VFA81_04090 [Burkholderiales bacterium]|nr:hypothetical protein [Burkholderiales bacterium]